MSDPMERQRERELARRRENELKDLEVESRHEQRPLEGLSGAHTSWTGDQDDRAAATEHAGDEDRSRRASEEQVPADPSGGHTLPERGDPESR
jgi:hypothetical protein